jgi:hypothetical protein
MKRSLPWPALVFGVAALVALAIGAMGVGAVIPAQEQSMQEDVEQGFEPLLVRHGERYSKAGWNHYGPGHFTLDRETGVLESHGGMGLLWYAVRDFADFELALEFKTSDLISNSGVFVRVPGVPTSDDYIYHSFEVQIHDAGDDVHRTGAVYDAEAPTRAASRPTGEWNDLRIRFVGDQIGVWLNGEQLIDWKAEPRGKVEDFADRGYIGLQNHDEDTSVSFRNIRVRDLATD